jgi:hypothetical protein
MPVKLRALLRRISLTSTSKRLALQGEASRVWRIGRRWEMGSAVHYDRFWNRSGHLQVVNSSMAM